MRALQFAMAEPAVTTRQVPRSSASGGPSVEMRRFSAGMRAIVALLCTPLLIAAEPRLGPWAIGVLLAYALWAGWVLWAEATARPRLHPLVCYWIDVVWCVLTIQLTSVGTMMMVLTLVQPVVLASIGYGVRRGVLLAVFSAVGIAIDARGEVLAGFDPAWPRVFPALAVLALVPAAAVLSRPMSMLRERFALVDELGAKLDPRRGLEAMCASLADSLRRGTQSHVVGLVLPSKAGSPAVLNSGGDGSFRTSPEVHQSLEALLHGLPDCPLTYVRRRWFDLRGRTRLHDDAQTNAELDRHLDQLAELLEVRTVLVVPLLRYDRRHGHLLLGHADSRARVHDITALSHAAPELFRLLEQAALVDQLQEESASHERARIGRDLHDSAIQPYLGLKYAVECVALRIPPDNPARAEVDALADLVNAEVAALRELISGLRTGTVKGDNALVPAVRRQIRRFSLLFGVDVQFDSPDNLPTSRALAGALFHMVNEALNNVRKHTGARHVWLALSVDASAVRLVVRDDAGSVCGQPVDDFMPRSLSERAAELGGALSIARPDGLNTELTITIPL